MRRAMKRTMEDKPEGYFDDRKRVATESTRYGSSSSRRDDSSKLHYEESRSRDYGNSDSYSKVHSYDKRDSRYEGRDRGVERRDDRYDRRESAVVRNGRQDAVSASVRDEPPTISRRGAHGYETMKAPILKQEPSRRYELGSDSWSLGADRSSLNTGKSSSFVAGFPSRSSGPPLLGASGSLYQANQPSVIASSLSRMVSSSFGGGDRFDAYKQQVPMRRF